MKYPDDIARDGAEMTWPNGWLEFHQIATVHMRCFYAQRFTWLIAMTPSIRILLVGDEADTPEVIGMLLGACGYEVVEVSSRQACLAAIDGYPRFDVIVADICQGGGASGVKMVEEIRRKGSVAPLIMTSGDPYGALAAQSVNAFFLPKPYGRGVLLAALRSVCTRHRQTLVELREFAVP